MTQARLRRHPAHGSGEMNPIPADPASVVQRQLAAFNARDVDALLAVYAADAEMLEHPATLVARGAEELRERFTARFRDAAVQAELIHRMVSGNTVVDHEKVRWTFPEGEGEIELVMIYEVRNGRIARAWSITGAKTLFGGAGGKTPMSTDN